MSEKLPTINIKGKEYVQVKDRIIHFNENYKNGSITTELLSDLSSKLVIIKATVTPDVTVNRLFTGYSQATIGGNGINATAALENCETSAVGRALGMMGIGVIESIASADEVVKAIQKTPYQSPAKSSKPTGEYMPSIKIEPNWSKSQQSSLIESGEYKVVDFKKKDGTILKQLVNKQQEWSWLDKNIAQYLFDSKPNDLVSQAQEIFQESPAAKANRETYGSL